MSILLIVCIASYLLNFSGATTVSGSYESTILVAACTILYSSYGVVLVAVFVDSHGTSLEGYVK